MLILYTYCQSIALDWAETLYFNSYSAKNLRLTKVIGARRFFFKILLSRTISSGLYYPVFLNRALNQTRISEISLKTKKLYHMLKGFFINTIYYTIFSFFVLQI